MKFKDYEEAVSLLLKELQDLNENLSDLKQMLASWLGFKITNSEKKGAD